MAHWKAYTFSKYNDYLQWKVVNKCLEDSFVIRLLRYTVKNVLKEGWMWWWVKECHTEFIILIDKKSII